jgi:hypothetical protein
MSIINTKYKTLCIDPNFQLILEDTSNINLVSLDYAIKKYRKGEKKINIYIGPHLEFDLTLKMIVVINGFRIKNGYFVTSASPTEYIIKYGFSTDKIIDLLENFHHLLEHT